MWIEDHIERTPESIGYSGSSGGALVAGTLSSGIDAQDLASFVIDKSFPIAGKNPFLLLGQCEIALDTVSLCLYMYVCACVYVLKNPFLLLGQCEIALDTVSLCYVHACMCCVCACMYVLCMYVHVCIVCVHVCMCYLVHRQQFATCRQEVPFASAVQNCA
jgi:hypothetical protein